MATMASAARDIRKTSGRDNLTAVAARSVPVTRPHHLPQPLPTPPNSISPTLGPHGLKAQLQRAQLESIDSDLDLQDGHDDHGDHSTVGSPPVDAAGAITPVMLARFHLPGILLNNGPLAIRHIMGHLTANVPGFSAIPPTKARRLVVAALEGRGSGCEGGGVDGDVEFEKVGWGRWEARQRGQLPQQQQQSAASSLSHRAASPTDSPFLNGLSGIPISNVRSGLTRSRLRALDSSSGEAGNWAAFSHDDRDVSMMAYEADKMSLDGSGSASCSEAPDADDDMSMKDDPEDDTDDEDWAAVGAAALRASSYQAQTHAASSFGASVHTAKGFGMLSVSGMARAPQLGGSNNRFLNTNNNNNKFDFSAFGASDAQEREAVEALLRLGSV